MKAVIFIILIANLFAGTIKQNNKVDVVLTNDEKVLYDLIMQYRKSKKLPKIPLSKSLTIVAQAHAIDLSKHKPDFDKGCNGHSWSSDGKWTSCCYTDDHAQAKCMWNKPRELTNYKDNGYEIVNYATNATPKIALDSWKKSSGHNQVIINEGVWKKATWNAIGIGIKDGYACVWFGKTLDAEK